MSLLDSTKCHDQDTLIEWLGRPGQVASCLAQMVRALSKTQRLQVRVL
nr:MAG TPA: hypothetical protein [Caudoviricetes sp.]